MHDLKVRLVVKSDYTEVRSYRENYTNYERDRGGVFFEFNTKNIRFVRECVLNMRGCRFRGLLLGLRYGELFFEKIKIAQFLFDFESILRSYVQEYKTMNPRKRIINLVRRGAYICPYCDSTGKYDWVRKVQGKNIFFNKDHQERSISTALSCIIPRTLHRVSRAVVINKPILEYDLGEEICHNCYGAGFLYPNLGPDYMRYGKDKHVIYNSIKVVENNWSNWLKVDKPSCEVLLRSIELYTVDSIRVSSKRTL